MNEIEALFSRAIDPDTLRVDPTDPRYTVPRTWGVYEIGATQCGPAGKRFRKGNHPVRHQELQREFGNLRVVALFVKEKLAVELASQMNGQETIASRRDTTRTMSDKSYVKCVEETACSNCSNGTHGTLNSRE